MRKSIFFLLILLIACSPASTSTPTSIPIPPTATVTPSPTEIPSPTPTPEGFQTSPDGAVQVFENGKWVDVKAPGGIWGTGDGISVVLVDNEEGGKDAFTQIELNGYQTPDGSFFVNIAKYDTGIKKWVSTDFSFTRSSGEGLNYATRNNDFIKHDIGPRIDLFSSTVTLLGLKYEKGEDLKVMVLYKNEVKVIKPDELVLYEFISLENHPTLILDANNLDLNDVLQIIRFANESHGIGYSKITSIMSYMVATPGTTEEDCNEIGKYFYDSPTFKTWCKEEISKGNNRKIFNKDNIDWELRNKVSAIPLSPDSDFSQLQEYWDDTVTPEIDGTYINFQLTT